MATSEVAAAVERTKRSANARIMTKQSSTLPTISGAANAQAAVLGVTVKK